MNRREASKNETKQLILKAARILFAKKGMEECTIRDIAEKAGVSPASVVVHFKSKTALLEEALYKDIEITLSELIASMPDGTGLLDRFMYLAKGMFLCYDKNRHLYRALLRNTIFEPVRETPNMTKQSEQYIRLLAGMVEEQKKHGVVRPEVDSLIAASSIFSLYLGALTVLFRMPEVTVENITESLTSMTEQFMTGILRSKQ